MAKTIITDEQIDPESPVTSELLTALRDNAGADIQTFTASGTWTKPDSTALVFVYLWGGGGGGASRSTNETSSQGGAGGGFVMHTFNEIDLASSVSVTIGAGGAAGVGSGGGSVLLGLALVADRRAGALFSRGCQRAAVLGATEGRVARWAQSRAERLSVFLAS